MNREIKFRAWNESGMVEWENLKSLRYAIQNANIVVMQFTGLKDKNGEEIYEFDIIQSPNTTIWTVEWNNEHSCFQAISGSVIMSPIDNINCQIIGNSFENPELLTN